MKTGVEKLHDAAVEAAITGEWAKAIKLNTKIISQENKNLDAHLRLAFAHLSTGTLTKAKKAYIKALKLQPANLIAANNLEKIRIMEKKGDKVKSGQQKNPTLDPNLFINIVGKTKVVSLINIGQASLLVKLKIGQPVNLKVKRRKVEVRSDGGDYIGALPDDISKRLILFMEAGSSYLTFIKEASKNSVDVFIKEEKKPRKVAQYTSFPKNIADDIRLLAGVEDEEKSEEGEEAEDEDEAESPLDIEKMAEEVPETDFFPQAGVEEEEEEEE